ncbi:hypothetical protein Salat_1036600 [Sesamum alatum]|uniref:Uncharacterized protein n=1 Tax=Sesamum alatum TaxID=300844 RepID=A0AAE1YMJ1_9LAMI|nr:hypothetical protein Salat_1036600 [Sesamum alatum]
MEEERKRKPEKAEKEKESRSAKATAALWPDGASASGGGAAVVVNEGLPDEPALGTIPEFDPDKEVPYTDLNSLPTILAWRNGLEGLSLGFCKEERFHRAGGKMMRKM